MLRRVARRAAPLLGRAAGPEQHLEGDARVANHRERLARRRPTDGVGVGARVVVGAPARLVEVLDAELHGRHRRRLAEPLRVELIERRADEEVRALGLLGVGLGQEHGGRPEVVAADLGRAERLGHPHVGVADDGHVVPERFERLEGVVGRQLEVGPHRRRREQMPGRAPLVAAGQPVHLLDAHEAGDVRSRRGGGPPEPPRRNHRVEERQRHRGSHAAQERPPGELLAGNERHRDLL